MTRDPDAPLHLAVHAVIPDRRGRLLLLRRSEGSPYNPGRWEFPGGRIERGEGVRDALVREVGEETGLAVGPGRLLGAGNEERHEGRVVHLVMAVVASDGEVALSEEHDAFRWVTPKGLCELPLTDWMQAWYAGQAG
ncbi:MAG: NUDIX domain-containing protein [Methanospirillum sp.]|nr:NUDIX domain-containing protein [Methanospirillum sp.]